MELYAIQPLNIPTRSVLLVTLGKDFWVTSEQLTDEAHFYAHKLNLRTSPDFASSLKLAEHKSLNTNTQWC